MQENKTQNFIKNVLDNMPKDWLNLTTHRLDIYNEELAKQEFLVGFENLYQSNNSETSLLENLPTAYDYIRLGHPLSCILEWAIAKKYHLKPKQVISFDSKTMPVLAILRKNLLDNKKTQILYSNSLPKSFNKEILRDVYGYNFELHKIKNLSEISSFKGSTILLTQEKDIFNFELDKYVDFYVNIDKKLGSVLLINGNKNEKYISEIQHVRRRETIAMTPINCYTALNSFIDNNNYQKQKFDTENNRIKVYNSIKEITETTSKPIVASSGLSIQYAIMMGLIHDATKNYSNKAIKFIVPTNCYGGTNDQARRVAACIKNVEIVDLAVDGENDMVHSLDKVLHVIAKEDAIPYIIAEIPTNPRVEVPNLNDLKSVLTKERNTTNGEKAISPVFILDQTFCPNVHFLGEGEVLSAIKAISYASGSKFPSGGKCTAGYCVANEKAKNLIEKIELHLHLCDNEATELQYKILAEQIPSMNKRIYDAYKNTRDFVNFIKKTLPEAKINFVSEKLATQGFTPSVFSLDLPTKGNNAVEKELYKRKLNHKLINLMITKIPNESKYCVSYGQLKGCYWTIPATSTQGTTKEGDKDYIARVALSGNMDLDLHKDIFLEFVRSIN